MLWDYESPLGPVFHCQSRRWMDPSCCLRVIVGLYNFSRPFIDPTQDCAADHFSIVKGFIVNRYCLRIIKAIEVASML